MRRSIRRSSSSKRGDGGEEMDEEKKENWRFATWYHVFYFLFSFSPHGEVLCSCGVEIVERERGERAVWGDVNFLLKKTILVHV